MQPENYGHPTQFSQAELGFPPIPHHKKNIALRLAIGTWITSLALLMIALTVGASNWGITTLLLAIMFYGGNAVLLVTFITAIVEIFTKKQYLHSGIALGLCLLPFGITFLFMA